MVTPRSVSTATRVHFSRTLSILRKRFYIRSSINPNAWFRHHRSIRLVFLIVLPLLFFCSLVALIAQLASTHVALRTYQLLFNTSTHSRRPDHRAIYRARARWRSRPPRGELAEEFWNKIKHDVVIGIKTGHEVAEKRLNKLRTFGWWSVGRDVPNFLVISDADDPVLGTVSIKPYGLQLLDSLNASTILNSVANGNSTSTSHHIQPIFKNNSQNKQLLPKHWFEKSGWRGDKDKNLPAFHLLRTFFPGKKWYLLLDDDTYIFLENFARFTLQDGMDSVPVYTGKVFYISRCGGFARDGRWIANHSEPRGMFAHGGSGIVMNRLAIDAMYPNIASCILRYSSCWAGDMQVGLCLRRAGVMVRRLGPRRGFEKHFIPFWPSKALSDRRYSSRWKSADEPITFHKIPDKEMRIMSGLERRAMQSGDSIIYADLKDYLLKNDITPAHSKRDRANKYYSTEFMPANLKR